eukprot:EG_transcript_28082
MAGVVALLRPSSTGRRQTASPMYSGDDWNPTMGTTLGDLFGSSSTVVPEFDSKPDEDNQYHQDLEISSEAGADYSLLKQLLKDQQWELADNEHRRLLIELSGPAAEAREYAWPTEVTGWQH